MLFAVSRCPPENLIVRTGIKVRHHETLARHPTRLVDEHVRSLVVRVVGDQETGGVGVMRVERLNDLRSLSTFSGRSDQARTMRTDLRAWSGTHVQTLLHISAGQEAREHDRLTLW